MRVKKIGAIIILCLLGISLLGGCQREKTPTKGIETTEKLILEGDFVFESLDFNGDPIDSDIFADFDVTIVNIWGTYCPPCLMEMPMLADLYDNLPENVNLLGICVDTHMDMDQDNLDLGKEMVLGMKINYTNIQMSETLMPITTELSKSGIPMTVFVDREGNLYNKKMLGAILGQDRMKEMIEQLAPFINHSEWSWSYEDGY